MAAGTVGLCALQAGVTERALELTAEYARTRVQFGKPIGGFQAVAQRLTAAIKNTLIAADVAVGGTFEPG